jgi:hypothetical protein
MELQFIFSLHGADDGEPFYFTLARQVNDLFQFREKVVLIMSVLVEVVVSFYIFRLMCQFLHTYNAHLIIG